MERYSEGFEKVPVEPIINEILSLAKILELEMDRNSNVKLVEEHSQDLTTEELVELYSVSQQEIVFRQGRRR